MNLYIHLQSVKHISARNCNITHLKSLFVREILSHSSKVKVRMLFGAFVRQINDQKPKLMVQTMYLTITHIFSNNLLTNFVKLIKNQPKTYV